MTSIYDDAGNYYGEALVDEDRPQKTVKTKQALKRQTSRKRPPRKPKCDQKKRR